MPTLELLVSLDTYGMYRVKDTVSVLWLWIKMTLQMLAKNIMIYHAFAMKMTFQGSCSLQYCI